MREIEDLARKVSRIALAVARQAGEGDVEGARRAFADLDRVRGKLRWKLASDVLSSENGENE